jgi:tetratricopeptide (TPR) repeat protein
MRIDLTGVRSRVLFGLVVFLAAGILAFAGGEAWLAEHWNASSESQLWQKAARLEPGDAEYWRHLGLYRQWDVGHGDNQQAVRYLQRATGIDPRSAGLWMDLAEAYQASGDSRRAEAAYGRAQADYPISSEVAWRYGSFLLYEGKFVEGYAEIRRALLVDPSLSASAVSECWQANPSIAPILDEVLPAKAEYYVTAMDFFLSQNLFDPALAVWNRQVTLNLPIKMAEAIPLLNALIDQNRIADAQQGWRQAVKAANWPEDRSDSQSLVFNGGFENDIANGGFGWREIPVSGVRVAYDSQVAHSEARSMRIEFDGTANLDFQNLFQYVPVQPRTRYRFSAYLRTEEISTESGMRFEIFDPRHPSEVQILTPNLTGTNPWTPVQADFETGADTELLEIAVRRTPEWKFDNKLSGTVWVDDVSLLPSQAATKSALR